MDYLKRLAANVSFKISFKRYVKPKASMFVSSLSDSLQFVNLWLVKRRTSNHFVHRQKLNNTKLL